MDDGKNRVYSRQRDETTKEKFLGCIGCIGIIAIVYAVYVFYYNMLIPELLQRNIVEPGFILYLLKGVPVVIFVCWIYTALNE